MPWTGVDYFLAVVGWRSYKAEGAKTGWRPYPAAPCSSLSKWRDLMGKWSESGAFDWTCRLERGIGLRTCHSRPPFGTAGNIARKLFLGATWAARLPTAQAWPWTLWPPRWTAHCLSSVCVFTVTVTVAVTYHCHCQAVMTAADAVRTHGQ